MLLAWLCAAAMASAGAALAAQPPHPIQPAQAQDLGSALVLHQVPASGALDPDVEWARPWPAPGAAPVARTVAIHAGHMTVGRLRLGGVQGTEVVVLQAPSSRLDRIRLWWRVGQGPWRASQAGDRVPLAEWPFYGPAPAFALPVGEAPVDVLVALDNHVDFSLPLLLKPQKAYSEDRLRQANLSGVVMGMGLMVALVCLLSASSVRDRAGWVLAAFAAAAVLAVTCLNGYAAIWLWPDWPAVNDGAKLASVLLLAALLLWSVAALVDRLDTWQWRAWAGPVSLAGAATAAALLLGPLPEAWQMHGTLAFTALCVGAAAVLCLASRLRGGRHVSWVAVAVALFAAMVAAGSLPIVLVRGLDLLSAVGASLLFAAALLLRHAHFARLRYGRDVLGRAAVGAHRDPLTALLSLEGLRHRHAEIALREAAGQPPASLLVVVLAGFERSGAEHGFVVTERALVRLAALLQSVLGPQWAVARLGKSRFAAFGPPGGDAGALVATATRILTHCARQTQPLSLVAEFDLRIACRHRLPPGLPLDELLQETEAAALALEGGRRITLL